MDRPIGSTGDIPATFRLLGPARPQVYDPPAPADPDPIRALMDTDAGLTWAIDKVSERVNSLEAALDADITANAARDSAVAELRRDADAFAAWRVQVESAPLTRGNEMAPFLVALLRGVLAALIAGGSTALATAQMPGVDGRYALLAGATAALAALASRAGIEGMIDQQSADRHPPPPPAPPVMRQ